jgi:hypothetical protein
MMVSHRIPRDIQHGVDFAHGLMMRTALRSRTSRIRPRRGIPESGFPAE